MSQPDETPFDPALESLELEAQAAEGQAAAAAPQAAPSSTPAELRGVLEMCRAMLSPAMAWWPDFHTVWSDRTLDQISASGAEIMDRHGWQVGGILTQYGPYIALAGATIPPAMATAQAIKWRREMVAAQARAASRAQHPDVAAHDQAGGA